MEEKEKKNNKTENVIFSLIIIMTAAVSLIMKDSPIATFAAVCGMSYTVLAGKGKIYCYLIGMCGTLCYAFLSFKNALFGNCALYALYYFPMEIIGITKWREHINPKNNTIIKQKTKLKEHVMFLAAATLISLGAMYLTRNINDVSLFEDVFATVFSIYGMYLTVKRCIRQWDIWFFVNILTMIAWIKAYMAGSGVVATILMWLIYAGLAIYFKIKWEKEIKSAR